VWSAELSTGYLQGCTLRPAKGSRFCSKRLAERTAAPEEVRISSHREVFQDSRVLLQYEVDGHWRQAADVPVSHVRAYELSLLRRRTIAEDGSCSKDDRKGISETQVGRKTSGILVAVTPCLQIVAIKPMYAAESLTQVVLLALSALALFKVQGGYKCQYREACALAAPSFGFETEAAAQPPSQVFGSPRGF